jgi:hypothetical protein
MKTMDGLRLFTVVGAMSLLGAGAAHAGAEVTHFKANGASASHNSFNGTTAFDLAVNRNDTPSGTTTFLSFTTQTCDATFSICTGVQGFGNIPSGDFSVAGATASLNTNLATNPGFTVLNFVQDNVNGTFTTTPGVGGIVTVNWKKIPRQSNSSTGTQTLVSGGFSTKLTGSQSSDSATSTGTLLGTPLPTSSSSFIGTTKSSQVIISRN